MLKDFCKRGHKLADTRETTSSRTSCSACKPIIAAEWYKKNAARCRATHKIWNDKNQDYRRQQRLERRYGITHEDYLQMLVRQAGVCAVCSRPEALTRYGRLSIDHNHETGEIRGLLCDGCNASLGHLQEDPETIRKLADYIELFNKSKLKLVV